MAKLYGFAFSHHFGIGVPLDLSLNEHEAIGCLTAIPGFILWMDHGTVWPLIVGLLFQPVLYVLVELFNPGTLNRDAWTAAATWWAALGAGYAFYYWSWWPLIIQAVVAYLVAWPLVIRANRARAAHPTPKPATS